FCFQAEDGIRDFHVTGVQTCALPISDGLIFSRARESPPRKRRKPPNGRLPANLVLVASGGRLPGLPEIRKHAFERTELFGGLLEIGRASCRAGGKVRVTAGSATQTPA